MTEKINPYKQFILSELGKVQKRERDQDYNYQITGMRRYYKAKERAEFLDKALQAALSVEESQDEAKATSARYIIGILNEIEGYTKTLPPELAVKKINDITAIWRARTGIM